MDKSRNQIKQQELKPYRPIKGAAAKFDLEEQNEEMNKKKNNKERRKEHREK